MQAFSPGNYPHERLSQCWVTGLVLNIPRSFAFSGSFGAELESPKEARYQVGYLQVVLQTGHVAHHSSGYVVSYLNPKPYIRSMCLAVALLSGEAVQMTVETDTTIAQLRRKAQQLSIVLLGGSGGLSK